MKYGLRTPCKTCPFVIDHRFPLDPERIAEIADASSFPCHNTVDYDYEHEADRDTSGDHQCFGWLILQWAQYRGFPAATAWMARAGLFDPNKLPTPEAAGCYGTFDEYIAAMEEQGL